MCIWRPPTQVLPAKLGSKIRSIPLRRSSVPNPSHQLRVHHPVSKRVPAAPSPQVDVGLLLEDSSVLGVRVCRTNREGGADESCSRQGFGDSNWASALVSSKRTL